VEVAVISVSRSKLSEMSHFCSLCIVHCLVVQCPKPNTCRVLCLGNLVQFSAWLFLLSFCHGASTVCKLNADDDDDDDKTTFGHWSGD